MCSTLKVVLALLGMLFSGDAVARSARVIPVDLVLVLAVDVSGSVSSERWAVQREGYARAFRSPDVQRAIASGYHGSIAVTFVEWSGPRQQMQIGGWHILGDRESSLVFAERLSRMHRMFFRSSTAIGSSLLFCNELIKHSPFVSFRRVIDISGDGRHTASTNVESEEGPSLSYSRRFVVKNGVTINGLPIVGAPKQEGIAEYYESEVIGGPGAFIEVVENPDDINVFTNAVIRKLIREIAQLN